MILFYISPDRLIHLGWLFPWFLLHCKAVRCLKGLWKWDPDPSSLQHTLWWWCPQPPSVMLISTTFYLKTYRTAKTAWQFGNINQILLSVTIFWSSNSMSKNPENFPPKILRAQRHVCACFLQPFFRPLLTFSCFLFAIIQTHRKVAGMKIVYRMLMHHLPRVSDW